MDRVARKRKEVKAQDSSSGPVAPPEQVPGLFCGDGRVEVEFEGTVVRGRCVLGGGMVSCGKRGCIGAEMSARSRLGLFERLARLPKWFWEGAYFITVTYPGWEAVSVDDQLGRGKRDLMDLVRRLRVLYGGFVGFWVRQFQRRGVIHFHLVVHLDAVECVLRHQVWALWEEAIGTRGHVDVRRVWNAKGVCRYLAKYLGKDEKARSYAAICGAEADAGGALGLDLVHLPYLRMGRHWGVFGEENSEGAVAILAQFPFDERFYQLRRIARHRWRGVSRRKGQGFMLMGVNVDEWMRLVVWIYGEDCVWSSD